MENVPFILGAEDRIAIDDLVTAFFWHLDRSDAVGAALLFAEDASINMGIEGVPVFIGIDSIRASIASRPAHRSTRHHWGGMVIGAASNSKVTANFQVVVYVLEADKGAPKASSFCDTQLELMRDPQSGKWKFEKMERTVIFAF